MSKIINNVLPAGKQFMPEIHLRQLGFSYSDCGPFIKTKKRIQKLEKEEIQNIFIKTN